ncbi:MAG: glycosyltransferase [Bacteroidales bacterium]|nr:glycosyltransferase [Bacteroidales bacterium]
MKLSIITINRNNASGLEKTMLSVASQTFKEFEYIVVDGASTDDSVEVIKRLAPQFGERLKWISEPDNGIYNGMNKGIRMASGEYIQILNSGDILAASDVTERMIAALEHQENEVGILYGNMIRDYGNGRLVRDKRKSKSQEPRTESVEWTMYDFIKGTVNHDPTYIHRSLYEKYGLYDESLKITSDWKWFVNAVVFGGEKLYYVPIDVTIFDTTGISETNLDAREKERRVELEKMLPAAILKDYDNYHFPIEQYKRLKKHHLWKLVYFLERVLFKFEKWHILR